MECRGSADAPPAGLDLRRHGGSMARTAACLGISRSTAKRHLAQLRARFGLSTEQLVYVGRATGRKLQISGTP